MKGPAHPERSFGISVGAMLMLIGVYAAWRGRMDLAQVGVGVGISLVALGLLRPSVLKYPSAAWWRLSLALGFINTRILLTLVFALVLTPLGLLWRIIRHDPLSWRRTSAGWTPAPARYRDQRHYRRMY
jgi:Saxitoxin biosynthesis operon protein SxtJ